MGTAASAPAPARQSRSKRRLPFIRKHHRLVTFFGALIVFGTFITKDVFRERLKDSSDVLQLNQFMYVLRADHQNLQNQLTRVEQQTRPIAGTDLNDAALYYDFAFLLDAEVRWPLGTVRTIQTHFRQLFEMAKLGKEKDIEEEMKKQENSWFEMQSKADNFVNRLYAIAEPLSANKLLKMVGKPVHPASPDDKKAFEQIQSQSAELIMGAKDLVVEQSNLGNAIAEAAGRRHQELEKEYDFYSKLSWLFYSVGWGLGLMARIVGVEGVGGSE